MSQPLSILNVGGQPKDVVLYAGGTMAKHAARGDRVCALTPTYGVSLHHAATAEAVETGIAVDVEHAKRERLDELKAACAELGVTDVRCLDYDDSIPIPDREIIVQISEIIRDVRPDIVITHHPNDSVVAHGMATQMLLAAMVHSSTTMSPGLLPHYPMQVFFHTQIGDTDLLEQSVPRIPDTIIDITDVVKTKARAMQQFRSQFYGPDSRLQRKAGETLDASVYGLHNHVPYSEPFLAYKPSVYEYLPLSEYGQKLNDLPPDEQWEYKLQMLLDDFEPQSE